MLGKLCEHYNYSRRQQVKVQPGNVSGDSGQVGKYTFMVCSFGEVELNPCVISAISLCKYNSFGRTETAKIRPRGSIHGNYAFK